MDLETKEASPRDAERGEAPERKAGVKREILMNTTPKETRVAILEDDMLVELMVDRAEADRMVGDVYLGKVEAVLPGIQAAFVNIGTEKAAFLHASDLASNGDGEDGEDGDEGEAGRGGGRSRKTPPIQDGVRKGQTLIVQVTKEPISTKGPRVTAQISLPGRFLVYIPDSDHVGVSRKIEDRDERARLRALAREALGEGNGGVIIRTVGEELTSGVFERELQTLQGIWEGIRKRAKRARAPAPLHREAKLIAGIVRDLFSQKVDSLVIDDERVFDEVRAYLDSIDPSLLERVRLYDGAEPLFDAYGIEEAIEQAFRRKVMLSSGGHIIIEPTEALVSIDVNTGRYTGKRDPEKTILRTNLDAAHEIGRQLRLRDIGGIIVCDFIDMESKPNQERVLQELRTELARDRARTRAYAVSELGLIEMTRQRVRPSLYQSQTAVCSCCSGTGRVFTPETVLRRVERAVRRAAKADERKLVARVHPDVALYALEEEPGLLARLGKETGAEVTLRDNPLVRQDDFRLLTAAGDQDLTKRFG
ncbi:ribonuclease G [soil metagenome]